MLFISASVLLVRCIPTVKQILTIRFHCQQFRERWCWVIGDNGEHQRYHIQWRKKWRLRTHVVQPSLQGNCCLIAQQYGAKEVISRNIQHRAVVGWKWNLKAEIWDLEVHFRYHKQLIDWRPEEGVMIPAGPLSKKTKMEKEINIVVNKQVTSKRKRTEENPTEEIA